MINVSPVALATIRVVFRSAGGATITTCRSVSTIGRRSLPHFVDGVQTFGLCLIRFALGHLVIGAVFQVPVPLLVDRRFTAFKFHRRDCLDQVHARIVTANDGAISRCENTFTTYFYAVLSAL